MAGHSKWAQIKRKKAVTDQKRGKVFSKLSKAITVAARLDKNLDLAIEMAKAENMPKDNIDRAIKKGLGETNDAAAIEEIDYEAYGPFGVAIIIKTLTDNKNRTVSQLRATFNKHGGQLATSGAVKYLFDYLGVIELDSKLSDDEQLEAIEQGALNIIIEEEQTIVHTNPTNLMSLKSFLELQLNKKATSASLQYIPKTNTELDNNQQEKIIQILEIIDDLEDTQEVFTNAAI